MLSVKGISLSYDGAQVLNDVSIEVGTGQIVALLGANGAGKSTTLKAVSGLEKVSAGTIEFDGHDITNRPSFEIISKGLAHSPEGRRLFPRMSVEENLILGTRPRTSRPQIRELLDEAFELFPILKERRKQFAGLMSGGEQQQCAIARALMSKPRLVLLDEPSLGLAPQIIADVFRVVQKIRDTGVTVLLVEQNMVQSLAIADHAYVLERGRVTLSGPASELRENAELQRAYLGI
ncbi:ABC transporter ATP-binding protein [Salinibacterium sp. NG253]|uniref:ABC transporter ATP-binding protein n=1 Tax=Salinibacterium sp. NG253 TaxID=2792039 RepID=UPI0018CD29E2|nr:ABC transporter ATP-binding protein [Salinibacterium sp. NG253]MBH0116784.1 ABC transporter ATP-binding protein [Salinibacterium sp. NG253]